MNALRVLLEYALPIAAALLLIAFFTGLPALKSCLLPGEEPVSSPLPRPGRRGRFPAWLPDLLLVLLIAGAYAVPAFTNLGDRDAPQTFVPMHGRTACLTLEADAVPSRLMLYTGIDAGSYEILYSEDGESWTAAYNFEQDYASVLKWHALTPALSMRPRYVQIRCTSGTPWLGELTLLDGDGLPIPVSCDIPQLCDEAETAPAAQSYLNSSYFDEIYHARTAWEHLNGIWPYEISHPPLGKIIISLGIRLLGMTPFGWRFMGTLFGVLMLPVLYLFLKKLFGGRAVPTLGTLLFASDFMHYTQTRIATVDTYAVFFILLMYLCMYVYLSRESLPALGLSGLFFGLGAASKWTCIYAGGGLAVLWLLHWIGRFVRARRKPEAEADPVPEEGPVLEESPEPERDPLLPAFFGNCLFCMVFFVFLPCLIYYLSYFPYGQARGIPLFSRDYLEMVWDNQQFMLSYHLGVNAEHPYASRWYQWVLDIRPILYYLEYFDDGTRSSICAFLNPAICWGGLLSLFVLGYTALFRRDRKAAFILLGYLAQLIPWMFVRRITFEYHYFPSSVFLILALCYVFRLMKLNRPNWLPYTVSFTAVSLLLFGLFFPALGGLPVDNSLATGLLGWLPTWPL